MDLSIRQTSRASKPYDPIHHIPFTHYIHSFPPTSYFTMHNVLVAASALLLAHCGASPIAALKARQSCPEVHVFGARETTAPAGYGTASVVVDLVLGAYAGATSEAIDYPAWYGASATFRVTLYCN
jgi:hypothetical protein